MPELEWSIRTVNRARLLELYFSLEKRYWRLWRRVITFIGARQAGQDVCPGAASPCQRHVIIHYHNFKTAGSSIDYLLQRNFAGQWLEWEDSREPDRLAAFIRHHPDLKAVSSHRAIIRPPVVEECSVLPVVFMRHPLDRIPSAYRFYRRKRRHQGAAAEFARAHDLGSFIAWSLEQGDFQNSYAYRLGDWRDDPVYRSLPLLDRVRHTLEELPYIGLVDRFEDSLRRLIFYLEVGFPGFRASQVRINSTRDDEQNLHDRLKALRKEIGHELYGRLCDLNEADLVLYEWVRQSYENGWSCHSPR